MTQVPFRLTRKILRETTHQVRRKSGAAHMKSILRVTASQAMSLMIGTGLNANSKRSLSSPKTGIAFRAGLPRVRKPKLTISATWKRLKGQSDDDADDFRKGSRVRSMRLSDFKIIRSLILPFDGLFLTSRLRSLRRGRSTSPTAVLTLALGIFASGCNKGQAAAAMPVPEVEVATVETRDVPIYGEWVATLDGYVNAEIRPQVSGYITKQNYTEGSLVRKGQVLFEIDPRLFRATCDRAKGDLAQAEAQLGKSTLDVERDTPLAEARAIAKSQLDNEVQAKLGAQAAVESAELDLQLEISRRTLTSRQNSLQLTQVLAKGGATSMLDVRQAEQLVFTAAETIPD